MPHLHLPVDHTDADLVLAASLAEIVGSEDLYVAWSHDAGPGAVPEVEAVVHEEPARGGFLTVIAAFWRALLGRPADDATEHGADPDPARRPAERPYADS